MKRVRHEASIDGPLPPPPPPPRDPPPLLSRLVIGAAAHSLPAQRRRRRPRVHVGVAPHRAPYRGVRGRLQAVRRSGVATHGGGGAGERGPVRVAPERAHQPNARARRQAGARPPRERTRVGVAYRRGWSLRHDGVFTAIGGTREAVARLHFRRTSHEYIYIYILIGQLTFFNSVGSSSVNHC